jgi:hypothetical protein
MRRVVTCPECGTTSRVGLTVALLAVAFGGAPAPSNALTAKHAKFVATLTGTQHESSTVPGEPGSPCPTTVESTENLGFQTRAPFKLDVTYLGSQMIVGPRGSEARLTATGSVVRSKTGVACADPDDRDKPLDCGTRQFSRWRLFVQAADGGLNLQQEPLERRDLFANCTPFGTHFPQLLSPEDRLVVAHVSRRTILDRRRKTITVNAHATETDRLDGGGSTRTTLSYTLKLRRR